MKHIDAKTCTYSAFVVERNDTDPKFKVGDHVRVSK